MPGVSDKSMIKKRSYKEWLFQCINIPIFPHNIKKKQLKSISKEHNDDLLSFEESDIENGGIKIDELENKDFECKVIFVFCLCAVHF